MYLSRIKLDITRSDTMRAFVSPNLIHGALECAETDGRTRKLWRIDRLGNEQYLLIVSESALDFSITAKQFGGDTTVETKSYDGLLARIVNGSQWQFRLKANPTVQKTDAKTGRGKPIAHITPKHQEEWLKRQAEKHGFSLSDDEWRVTGSQWYRFRKGQSQHKVCMLAVTYEGILTVTDADLFRNALTQGIGREKAYGMGMLTVTGVRK